MNDGYVTTRMLGFFSSVLSDIGSITRATSTSPAPTISSAVAFSGT
jgi:hypothetical protein